MREARVSLFLGPVPLDSCQASSGRGSAITDDLVEMCQSSTSRRNILFQTRSW